MSNHLVSGWVQSSQADVHQLEHFLLASIEMTPLPHFCRSAWEAKVKPIAPFPLCTRGSMTTDNEFVAVKSPSTNMLTDRSETRLIATLPFQPHFAKAQSLQRLTHNCWPKPPLFLFPHRSIWSGNTRFGSAFNSVELIFWTCWQPGPKWSTTLHVDLLNCRSWSEPLTRHI